ncbi:MAG TPA: LamG-like jellyroll fold domain-containing protein, partial [Verrucomicrobiae bacterium]
MADAPAGYWRLGEMPSYVDPIGIVTNSGSLGDSGTGTYVGYVRGGEAGAYTGSSAYRFRGGAGRVSITNSAAFNFTGTTPFTLEVWAKPTVAPSGTQRLISNGSAGQGYGFTLYGADRLRMTGLGVADVNSDFAAPWAVGTWYHLALVRSNTYLYFYTNGVQLGARKTLNNIITTANPLALGATGLGGEAFTGALDDAAVYTNILTPAQIAAHYAAAINNPAGYPAAVLADQPIGYWQLNEPAGTDTGTVIANSGSVGSGGNGEVLAPPNGIVGGAAGALVGDANPAMTFGGSPSRIEVQQKPALNTSNFTFECWANLGTWAGTHQSPVTSRGSANGYIFYAAPFSGATRWEFWTGPGWDVVAGASADVVAGQWTHLVGSYDAVGRTKVFYVNGQLISGKVNVSVSPNSTSPLRIGAGATEGPIGNYFWNGVLDEVAVYPTVLSPERVQAHYEAALGVSPGMTAAPTIAADPVAQTNWAPYPVALGCVIAGSLPMQLQWYYVTPDGLTTRAVANATNTVLKLDPTDPTQSGSYFLTATNTLGTAASAWAYVEIIPLTAPTITSQPLPRTVYAGSSTRFTVQAAGTPPLTYQWKKGGADISGATNTVLVLTNISAGDAAMYSAGVTNLAGGVVSAGAQLSLRTPPAGSYEEAAVNAGPVAYWRLGESAGSTTAFDWAGGYDGLIFSSVTAGTPGPSSPTYPGFEANNTAYTFNATDSGVQSSSLGLPGPISATAWVKPNALDATQNKAIVGEYGSWFFKLNNNLLRLTTPGILDHDSAAAVTAGEWQHVAVTFQPGAAAGAKFYVNGRFISSVTASALTRGNSLVWIGTNQWAGQVFDGVIDEVAVYSKILSADTIATMYALGAYGTTTPPLITAEPASQSVVVGTPVTLTVGAVGSYPLAYQWKKDGAAITGATTSALTTASATFADTGSYTVTITNAVGTTNSTAATLTVLAPPTFANATNDLVLHLKFDTDFTDSSGRVPPNDAYASGPPPLVAGKLGQGVRLTTQTATSVYQYLFVLDNPDLRFTEVDSFTVSCWLKYTTGFNDLPIIGNAHRSTYNNGWVLTEDGGQFEWTAVDGASIIADPVGGPLINDGTWHQLAVVFDRTNGVAASYVDGLLVDTRSLAGLGTLYTGLNLFIGQDDSGAYPT